MSIERRSGPGQRKSDVENAQAANLLRRGNLNPRENWYRDVFRLIALALMAYAIWLAGSANHTSSMALAQTAQGRATAVSVTCAALDAEVAAGQHVIGSAGPETAFDRALEKLGFPTRRQRVAQAQAAARVYAASINRRVEQELSQVGVKLPAHLIRSDGTIDCATMLRIANVPSRFIH